MNVYVAAFAQRASTEALDRFTDAVLAYLEQKLIGNSPSVWPDDAPVSAKHLNLAQAQV